MSKRRNSILRRVQEENSSSCEDEEEERDNERAERQRRNVIRRLRALLVIEFSPCPDDSVIQWAVAKMRAPLVEGGAELRVRILNRGQCNDPKRGTLLLLAASTQRLLEAAHVKRLPRKTIHNRWRTFNLKNVNLYLQPGKCAHQLLTTIEKQRFLIQFLGDVRAFPPEYQAPDCKGIIFCPGESISNFNVAGRLITWLLVRKFIQANIIRHIFPLHEENELAKVGYTVWVTALFRKKALEKVRFYFGDAIALHLAFVGICTQAMVLPAMAGIVLSVLRGTQSDLDDPSIPFLCMLNCIIILALSILWRRKCCELAYDWGSFKIQETSGVPRANYRGKAVRNPITGWCEYSENRWMCFARNIFISMPIMAIYRSSIGILAYGFFKFTDDSERPVVDEGDESNDFGILLIFAFILWMLQRIGEIIIFVLTEWENHRTDWEFEKHRTVKRANLLVAVNFTPLFYNLYLGNITRVANLLLAIIVVNYTMKIITQGIHNLPRRKTTTTCSYPLKTKDKCKDGADIIPPQDPVVLAARNESRLKRYYGQFDEDYFFPMTQLCLIFMFSSLQPLAATVAAIGNILSTIVDCFNLTRITQRPFNYYARCCTPNWRIAFDLLTTFILAVNCIIAGHSTYLRKLAPNDISDIQWIFIIIVIEHCLILIKYFLNQVISDVPHHVNKVMEEEELEENLEDATERHRSLQFYLSTNHRRYR